MKKLNTLLLAFVLFQIQSIAQGEVTIAGSQVRKITSSIVAGQEYTLQISLPSGYATSDKKFPVVYLMDSQWDFPLLSALYGEQYYDGFIPAAIIVGVTWGGEKPNPDSLRARDYTPTKVNFTPQSGGAPKFLSFMKNELFPYIESNYKADKNDRALVGCSLGGLFTLFALFTEPGLFQRYVAASPAFGWDREVIYQFEKSYAEKNPIAPARLYMIMGGVERGVPGFDKLVSYLNERHYKNIDIKTRVLENTGHSGTKGEGYARGLQFIYEKPSLNLSGPVLNQYTGSYQFANGGPNIEIKNEDNRLVLYLGNNNNNKISLFAATENDFYSKSEYLNIHFKSDGGKVNGFQLDLYGSSQFATKK